MNRTRRAGALTGLLAVAGVTTALVAGPLVVTGADHIDAPSAKADPRIDITDIYAFRSSPSQTTLVLNVNGLLSPGDTKAATFRHGALYELKVDRNGDAVADAAYRVRFSRPRTTGSGAMVQDYAVRYATGTAASRNEWSGRVVAVGRTTPYGSSPRISSIVGGGRAFVGPRDDPFFFDLPGFVQFKTKLLEGSTDAGELLGGFTGSDTFAGTNVLSIALRVPNARIGGTGRTVGIWATTSVRRSWGYQQLDRMGRPAINTVFNGTHLPLSSSLNNNEKEAFNHLKPTSDRKVASDNVKAVLGLINNVLSALGAPTHTAAEIDAITKTLLPDVLTVRLGSGAGFLNGRKLADDVIDAEFSLLTKGAVTSDGVNANDKSFSSSFPYLASPH